MKKLALAAVLAASVALPHFALANDPAPATAAVAAKAEAKPMELKSGGWVKVDAMGKAMVSKDEGKTWAAAPDGVHELKDGMKVETKGGMVVKH